VSLKPFENTGGKVHSTLVQASNENKLDEMADISNAPWVVICAVDETYKKLTLTTFGFDVTPPRITALAVPNPVIDSGNFETELRVSSDDEVVCTYLDDARMPIGFPLYDVNDAAAYMKTHKTIIKYWGKNLYDDKQEVVCRNKAGLVGKYNFSIHVEPIDNIIITIHNSKYVGSPTFILNVSTGQKANCSYRFSQTDEYAPLISTNAEYVHSASLTGKEGEQTIEVYCEPKGTGNAGVKFKKIIIDTKDPIMEIITNEKTCSLEKININLVADPTGSEMDYYIYKISSGSTQIQNGTSSSANLVLNNVDLEAGKQYIVAVEGYDVAGNKGAKSKTVVASEYDSVLCDDTAPESRITHSFVAEGAAIELNCVDEEGGSGCTDSFSYYYDLDGECTQTNNYTLGYYAQNIPLLTTKTTHLCYSIYDNANNDFTSLYPIAIKAHCLNGFEDDDETGIDCGGSCPVSCDSCNNGVHDAFEEDIDCGGVCETIRICSPDTTDENTSETIIDLDNDTLPDEWEMEFFEDLNETAEGDFDEDGFTNKEEHEAGTDPTEMTECVTDSDCNYGLVCDFNNECVEDKPYIPNKPYEEEDESPVGIILLLIGLLCMAAGTGYIYYTRFYKSGASSQISISTQISPEQEKRAQQQVQLAQAKKQQALQKARDEAQKKALEAMKKKKELEAETMQKHLDEREESRKSVLGAFDSTKKEEKETEKTVQAIFNDKHEDLSKTKKDDEKLDDGFNEDFIDVRDFDEERRKAHLESEKEKQEVVAENKETPLQSEDPFKALESLNSGKDVDVVDIPLQTTPAEKKIVKKTAEENPFDELESLAKKEHATLSVTKMSLRDLVELFEKKADGKQLDSQTIITTLHSLLDEEKIDAATTEEVLHGLVIAEILNKDQITEILTKL
jgi:uncharacterized membrane protein